MVCRIEQQSFFSTSPIGNGMNADVEIIREHFVTNGQWPLNNNSGGARASLANVKRLAAKHSVDLVGGLRDRVTIDRIQPDIR
jgi:hypothetical protein